MPPDSSRPDKSSPSHVWTTYTPLHFCLHSSPAGATATLRSLQPSLGWGPAPTHRPSATGREFLPLPDTGPATLRYCSLNGAKMISLKSFSSEKIFDLQFLSYPSTAVVLNRGTLIISADIFGYQDCGGAPPLPPTKDYLVPKINMLRLRNLILE